MRLSRVRAVGRESVEAARSALSFSTIPIVAVLVPLAVLPIASRRFGGDGLISIAVGQSVGSVVGLAVGLSYPLVGSNVVARENDSFRKFYYRQSVECRAIVYALVAPVASCAAGLLVDRYVEVAVIGSLANAALGFTAFWFYSGLGTPRDLLLYEVLPRVAAAILTIPAMIYSLPLVVYPLLLLTASGFGVVANLRSVQGSYRISISRETLTAVRLQAGATVSRLLNGLYFVGATSIVAVAAPASATLVFSAADRVQKSAYNGGIIFPQALVSWVGRSEQGQRGRRFIALAIDAIYCAIVGVALWLLFPVLVAFMFQGVVSVDKDLQIVSSAALTFALFSKCVLFHALLPLRLEKESARLLGIGSVVGAIAVGVWSHFKGAFGAAIAILAAEVAISLVGLLIVAVGSRLRFR